MLHSVICTEIRILHSGICTEIRILHSGICTGIRMLHNGICTEIRMLHSEIYKENISLNRGYCTVKQFHYKRDMLCEYALYDFP